MSAPKTARHSPQLWDEGGWLRFSQADAPSSGRPSATLRPIAGAHAALGAQVVASAVLRAAPGERAMLAPLSGARARMMATSGQTAGRPWAVIKEA